MAKFKIGNREFESTTTRVKGRRGSDSYNRTVTRYRGEVVLTTVGGESQKQIKNIIKKNQMGRVAQIDQSLGGTGSGGGGGVRGRAASVRSRVVAGRAFNMLRSAGTSGKKGG